MDHLGGRPAGLPGRRLADPAPARPRSSPRRCTSTTPATCSASSASGSRPGSSAPWARSTPIERLRWEDAHWHDEVLWARDRQTRRLLALIGVHFDADPFDDLPDSAARHATALFEFRKGRWHAEGKRLDEIRPDEAVRRNQRFEPVVTASRAGSSDRHRSIRRPSTPARLTRGSSPSSPTAALDVFLEVELVGPADLQQRPLQPLDLGAGLGQLRRRSRAG